MCDAVVVIGAVGTFCCGSGFIPSFFRLVLFLPFVYDLSQTYSQQFLGYDRG